MVCLHTQPNIPISDTVSDVPGNQFIGIYIDTVRRKAQCHTPILLLRRRFVESSIRGWEPNNIADACVSNTEEI
jgi:hypothetical protein